MPQHLIALALGYALDLVVGDPPSWPHPVRWMGALIARLEGVLRRVLPASQTGLRVAGVVLVVVVAGGSTAVCALTLWLCGLVSPLLAVLVEAVVCAQMLATKSLRDESMKVFYALEAGSLPDARAAVGMIVGRDTQDLSEEEVAKAAVETVAENASDGVAAPLFYMALFGAAGGVFYKAVNTMDSMVGYDNRRYRDFGWAAARFDDLVNWVPARIAGALMCAAAALSNLDARGAWRIFKRDRRNHLSPNAAHTEAACAGALDVQLGGAHYYFGKLVEKPTIGDASRHVEPYDIVRANRLMYATSALCFAAALVVAAALFVLGAGR